MSDLFLELLGQLETLQAQPEFSDIDIMGFAASFRDERQLALYVLGQAERLERKRLRAREAAQISRPVPVSRGRRRYMPHVSIPLGSRLISPPVGGDHCRRYIPARVG